MIRPARPEDIDAVATIAKAAYQPYVKAIGQPPAPMIADFAADRAQGNLWVYDSGQIDGYIVMKQSGKTGFIENVAVAPRTHGRGLGRELLAFAETRCVARGADRMILYTNIHMTPNLTLYPYLGYHETGRRTENGFERVYFEKRLAQR